LKSIDENPKTTKIPKQSPMLPIGVTLVLNDYNSALNALNPEIKATTPDF